MAYRYIDSEKLDARRRKSTKASGIGSILLGVFWLACGIFFLAALKTWAGMAVMLVLALVFIGGGVYFFNQIKIEEMHSRALDDPGSPAFMKRQERNARKREKYLRKAEHHGSLKSILCHRAALIFGGCTLMVWALTLIFLLIGGMVLILLLLDVLFPIAFVCSLTGGQYKKLLREYADYGLDKAAAERDFAASRAYLVDTDVVAVSPEYILSSETLTVVPVKEAVWAFGAYDAVHKYKSGMYSHTERNYCVIVGLSDGSMAKLPCPEELCEVMIDDITRVGNAVTAGYSEELRALYAQDPAGFRETEKNRAAISKIPVPTDVLQ